MICPSCGYENIQGEDSCDNCGADLRTSDIPQPANSFERRLLEEPLSALANVELLSIPPTLRAEEMVGRMQQLNVGSAVVEQDGRVLGIVTEADALLKLSAGNPDGLTASDLMTADPVVLRPDDSVAVAIHKMAVGGFRHIPLVDNGHAKGIVTARDLIRHILELID